MPSSGKPLSSPFLYVPGLIFSAHVIDPSEHVPPIPVPPAWLPASHMQSPLLSAALGSTREASPSSGSGLVDTEHRHSQTCMSTDLPDAH